MVEKFFAGKSTCFRLVAIAGLLFIAGFTVLFLSFLLESGGRGPADRLILSSISPPKSFNPVMARETSTTDITDRMFIGLTRADGVTGAVTPHLAKKWETTDNGRAWLFTLHDNLRWSDAQPLTASDVKFSYEQLYLNPEIPVSTRDILLLEGIAPEIKIFSDTQIEFRYHRPYAPFPRAAAARIMPEHILRPLLEKKLFESAWAVNTDPSEIVVNGPFKLKNYRSGQRVLLEKNPYYYEKDVEGEPLPRVREIQYEIVRSQDAQVQKFRLGELDAISLPPRYFPLLSPLAPERDFQLQSVGPAPGTNFLAFNLNTDTNPETGEPYFDPVKAAWFNDLSFRRAVSHAIDRDEIIRIAMNGMGVPLYGPVSPSQGKFYNPDIEPVSYSPAKAKQILDQAGYRDRNGDGYRQDADGNTIRFVIVTNAGNDQRVQMGQIIRKDLSRLGFQVGFNQVDFNALVNQLSHTYDWEAMVMGLTGSIDPHLGSNVWLSSGSLHLWHPRQEKPVRAWEAQIDDIFLRAVSATDPEQRRRLYFRWQEIVRENQPLIFLANSEVNYGLRDRLNKVNPTPIGGITHNIERIEIRTQP